MTLPRMSPTPSIAAQLAAELEDDWVELAARLRACPVVTEENARAACAAWLCNVALPLALSVRHPTHNEVNELDEIRASGRFESYYADVVESETVLVGTSRVIARVLGHEPATVPLAARLIDIIVGTHAFAYRYWRSVEVDCESAGGLGANTQATHAAGAAEAVIERFQAANAMLADTLVAALCIGPEA